MLSIILKNLDVWLKDCEKQCLTEVQIRSNASLPTNPPHLTIEISSEAPPLTLWGHCVELLWQEIMDSKNPTSGVTRIWNDLTPRLLIRDDYSGGGSEVVRWAREQVVRSMIVL
jgi:hypothetical protein